MRVGQILCLMILAIHLSACEGGTQTGTSELGGIVTNPLVFLNFGEDISAEFTQFSLSTGTTYYSAVTNVSSYGDPGVVGGFMGGYLFHSTLNSTRTDMRRYTCNHFISASEVYTNTLGMYVTNQADVVPVAVQDDLRECARRLYLDLFPNASPSGFLSSMQFTTKDGGATVEVSFRKNKTGGTAADPFFAALFGSAQNDFVAQKLVYFPTTGGTMVPVRFDGTEAPSKLFAQSQPYISVGAYLNQ